MPTTLNLFTDMKTAIQKAIETLERKKANADKLCASNPELKPLIQTIIGLCIKEVKAELQTEKEQIMEAYYRGKVDHPESTKETYYNLTFNQK